MARRLHDMNIRKLDLNLLVVFDALMRERSVTKAAARLFLTQPAVSHSLERLRTALGDPLFIRAKGTMAPTARAEALDSTMRPLLRELTTALTAAPFSPASLEHTFRIGTLDIGGFILMPHLLPRFQAEAPAARITISDFEIERFQAQLASGELDIVIAPKTKLAAGMHERLFVHQGHVVGVLRKDHPLARKRKKLSWPEFRSLRRVAMTMRGTKLTSPIEGALSSSDRALGDFAVASQHFIAALASLLGSDMMFISGDVVAYKLATHFPLRIVQLPVDLPPIDVMAFWHERTARDPAQRWFRNLVFEAGSAITASAIR